MLILSTNRLYLRTLQDNDAKTLATYRSKKEVKEYQSWETYTLQDAKYRIKQCKHLKQLDHLYSDYHLAIIQSCNHIMIGDLFVQILSKDTFTLGYTLDSQYWNKGYAYEIIEAFLNHMKTLSFKKVLCYVYDDNIRSIRLLKKLGFVKFEESYVYDDLGYKKYL